MPIYRIGNNSYCIQHLHPGASSAANYGEANTANYAYALQSRNVVAGFDVPTSQPFVALVIDNNAATPSAISRFFRGLIDTGALTLQTLSATASHAASQTRAPIFAKA